MDKWTNANKDLQDTFNVKMLLVGLEILPSSPPAIPKVIVKVKHRDQDLLMLAETNCQ